MTHPVYPPTIPEKLHKELDGFRSPKGTEPLSRRAVLHNAVYQLAYGFADQLPNGKHQETAIRKLREALKEADAALESE